MADPTAADILLRKKPDGSRLDPGDTFSWEGKTYRVNPGKMTAELVTAAPSTANQPPQVELSGDASLASKLKDRAALTNRYLDAATPAEEKTNILKQMNTLDDDIAKLQNAGKPVVAGPRSSVIDPTTGQTIYSGSGVTTASPGSAIINPKGEITGRVPESTSSITSAQAALVNAKVAELAQNNKLNEDQKKAAFDTWWKISIELPRQQEQDAMARQKYGSEQGDKAVQRRALQSQWDTATGAPMQDAIQQAFSSRGLAAPARQQPIGNIDDIASSASLKALRDISPTAQAAFGVSQPDVPAVATPSPAELPGAQPPNMATPISDATFRPPAPAANPAVAAAIAGAARPYQPGVGFGSMGTDAPLTEEELARLRAAGLAA